MNQGDTANLVTPDQAGTLAGLFHERVQRTPDLEAYRYHDEEDGCWHSLSWRETGVQVARWQAAFAQEGLASGDRVAVMSQNCPEWVMFDQGALSNDLVVVPLYTQDRAENTAYILKDADVKVLMIGSQEHWETLQPVMDQLDGLTRILALSPIDTGDRPDPRLITIAEWLPGQAELRRHSGDPDTLATIVYTSGTTGRPKGVMLSHYNILSNARAALQVVSIGTSELFLSFLPLSHTLERTDGYYLPMMAGSAVAYNRSIPQLGEDLIAVKPTILISVPRIFERVYNKIQAGLLEKSPLARKLFALAVDVGWQRFEYQQGRSDWKAKQLLWPLLERIIAGKVMEKLGGHMKLAVVGGAPLPYEVGRLFIGLGLPMIQGYGLTETSPVISVNPIENNDPRGVGCLLDRIEARIGKNDELLVKGPNVMLGYWNDEQATRDLIDAEGWLHTGDKARIDNGQIYITGRIKEIIVLSNGEKVPPADMEMAICLDGLFEQAMVIGDNRPFLSAVVVLDSEQLGVVMDELGLDVSRADVCTNERFQQVVLERISKQLVSFPGYARIVQVCCQLESWSIEDGLITPTLKLKRNKVYERYEHLIEEIYRGH